MLQALDASANEISHASLLPWPSNATSKALATQNGLSLKATTAASSAAAPCNWPYQQLRRLDLSRNLLTQLQDVPPMPALQTLILQVRAASV